MTKACVRLPASGGGRAIRYGAVCGTAGGLNSKLYAVCNGAGKPNILLLSEGQMSDHKGARLISGALPSGATLIVD